MVGKESDSIASGINFHRIDLKVTDLKLLWLLYQEHVIQTLRIPLIRLTCQNYIFQNNLVWDGLDICIGDRGTSQKALCQVDWEVQSLHQILILFFVERVGIQVAHQQAKIIFWDFLFDNLIDDSKLLQTDFPTNKSELRLVLIIGLCVCGEESDKLVRKDLDFRIKDSFIHHWVY